MLRLVAGTATFRSEMARVSWLKNEKPEKYAKLMPSGRILALMYSTWPMPMLLLILGAG
jgi:hypothetical protein